MKVYSYYSKIGFKNQEEIIELWKKNWSNKGFFPVLLSIEDAKKTKLLNRFFNNINYLHKYITDKSINQYGLACYFRWFAYSQVQDTDSFLVCDYDIFNINITEEYIKSFSGEKMSFLNGYCPCAAITNKKQCLSFVEDIISISEKYKDKIKEDYQNSKFIHYHDQEFLALNHNHLSNYFFEKPNDKIKLFSSDLDRENTKMIHFAHRSVNEFAKKIRLLNFDPENLRVEMIKSIM